MLSVILRRPFLEIPTLHKRPEAIPSTNRGPRSWEVCKGRARFRVAPVSLHPRRVDERSNTIHPSSRSSKDRATRSAGLGSSQKSFTQKGGHGAVRRRRLLQRLTLAPLLSSPSCDQFCRDASSIPFSRVQLKFGRRGFSVVHLGGYTDAMATPTFMSSLASTSPLPSDCLSSLPSGDLNPYTTLMYLSPDIGDKYLLSRYIYIGTLGVRFRFSVLHPSLVMLILVQAFLWDILTHLPEEYHLLFKHRFSLPVTVYFTSRSAFATRVPRLSTHLNAILQNNRSFIHNH